MVSSRSNTTLSLRRCVERVGSGVAVLVGVGSGAALGAFSHLVRFLTGGGAAAAADDDDDAEPESRSFVFLQTWPLVKS